MDGRHKAVAAAAVLRNQGNFEASNEAVIAECIRAELKLLSAHRVSKSTAEAQIAAVLEEAFPGLRVVSTFEIISMQDFSMWNVSLTNGISGPFWVSHAD